MNEEPGENQLALIKCEVKFNGMKVAMAIVEKVITVVIRSRSAAIGAIELGHFG